MSTLEGLRGLLSVTVTLVRSSSGDYEHVNFSSWSKVVNLDELADRANKLRTSSPEEADQRRAERFLKALDAGRKGPF
jgi:hypothetical protein